MEAIENKSTLTPMNAMSRREKELSLKTEVCEYVV